MAAITFRHPSFFAALVITLDHLSDGRVTVGLGSGGPPHPRGAFGHDGWTPREGAERLEERAAILDSLPRGETITLAGRHFPIRHAHLPDPVRRPRPPLVIATHGDQRRRLLPDLTRVY